MIDIRKLKELVRLMVDNELTELDLRDSEEQVTLRRGAPALAVNAPGNAAATEALRAAPSILTEEGHLGAGAEAPEAEDRLHRIASPMVGTFYATPSPDAQPFVSVGSNVGADTVVCIVEAMKLFNEIKAEVSGTIRKVLVKSGDAVEFGQPLFLVETG